MVADYKTILHPTIAIATYNTLALAWMTKGSTMPLTTKAFSSTNQPNLLCQSSHYYTCFHSWQFKQIADCFSRFFSLSDDAFCANMNNTFPLQPCWTLMIPPSTTASALICALSNKLLQSWFIWESFCQDLHIGPSHNKSLPTVNVQAS
jgi:hypothetical protein